MKICLEGWSKINHSFSISSVNKLLEFIKLPIDLKFKETSYANNLWNYSNNFHGFSDKNINKILSIKQYIECEVNFSDFYDDLNTKKENLQFSDLKLIFKDLKTLFEIFK